MAKMGQTKYRFINCDTCRKLVQLAGKQRICHECRRAQAKAKGK